MLEDSQIDGRQVGALFVAEEEPAEDRRHGKQPRMVRAADLQRSADELFSLYGRSADAPRADESDEGYMRRTLESAKRYSSTFCGFDFVGPRAQPRECLPSAWESIVADGVKAFKEPVGAMRSAITTDDSGRRIRKFYGDPENCWSPFKALARIAVFNPDLGRGANAPGAIKSVGTLLSDGTVRALRPE